MQPWQLGVNTKLRRDLEHRALVLGGVEECEVAWWRHPKAPLHP
jgi:hypothetical protein